MTMQMRAGQETEQLGLLSDGECQEHAVKRLYLPF